MKAHTNRRYRNIDGFNFIETMIVIAIIGVLAGAFIIKVMPQLPRAKYAAIALTVEQLQKATVAYLTKPGSLGILPVTEGSIPASQFNGVGADAANVGAAATFDQVLLAEATLQKPVSLTLSGRDVALAGNPVIWSVRNQRWESATAPSINYSDRGRVETRLSDPGTTPSSAEGANFNLSGDGVTYLPSNVVVAYLDIPNVRADMARELSEYIEGQSLSAADDVVADGRGSVVYPAPVNGFTHVYVYATHQ